MCQDSRYFSKISLFQNAWTKQKVDWNKKNSYAEILQTIWQIIWGRKKVLVALWDINDEDNACRSQTTSELGRRRIV